MKNEKEFTFKVMPWLRKVREENAKETEGMTPAQRVAHTQKRAQWFYNAHSEFSKEKEAHAAGEKKAVYNADKKSK